MECVKQYHNMTYYILYQSYYCTLRYVLYNTHISNCYY